ncbi:MAG: DPP IV N-terminal domain-containing protein, partial [Planctomycetota bacterium]
TLTRPAITIKFDTTQQAETEVSAAASDEPRGIINATGEDYERGDLIPKGDATVNDKIYEKRDAARRDGTTPPREEPAPRYAGISRFEWSPAAHEMLLLSEGDIFRLQLDAESWDELDDRERVYRGELERLTRTREGERSVAYLPDGSGYTYLRDGALLAVTFGNHKILQLDPSLEDGEQMVGYRISPDMDRLVFLASKSDPNARRKTVNIVTYRDRLSAVRQVQRTFPDDEPTRAQASIYLYDLTGHDREEGTLKRVFTRKVTGPRDVMFVPDWSPDSTKIAFSVFDQSTGQVSILEAGFDEAETAEPTEDEAGDQNAIDAANEDDIDSGEVQDGSDQADEEESETQAATQPATQPDDNDEEFKIENAKTVYRFLHNGGPNTPRMIMPRYLPDSRHMAFITELSGFRHLHILDPVYEQLDPVTSGKFEVYPFAQSDDHRRLFVTATVENDPAQEWLYEIDLETREKRRLCKDEGVIGAAAVSDDGNTALAIKSDFGELRELMKYDCAPGEEVATTVVSESHPQKTTELTTIEPEYFSFENRHGQTIYGHMFKPSGWSEDDERPLLLYVYGGPLGDRKMITRGAYSAPSYWFARYMAEKHGWVTATIDP